MVYTTAVSSAVALLRPQQCACRPVAALCSTQLRPLRHVTPHLLRSEQCILSHLGEIPTFVACPAVQRSPILLGQILHILDVKPLDGPANVFEALRCGNAPMLTFTTVENHNHVAQCTSWPFVFTLSNGLAPFEFHVLQESSEVSMTRKQIHNLRVYASVPSETFSFLVFEASRVDKEVHVRITEFKKRSFQLIGSEMLAAATVLDFVAPVQKIACAGRKSKCQDC